MAQVSKEGHEELSLGHTAFVGVVRKENEGISGREQPVPRPGTWECWHILSHTNRSLWQAWGEQGLRPLVRTGGKSLDFNFKREVLNSQT